MVTTPLTSLKPGDRYGNAQEYATEPPALRHDVLLSFDFGSLTTRAEPRAAVT